VDNECLGATDPDVERSLVVIPETELNWAVTVPEPPMVADVEALFVLERVIDAVLELHLENVYPALGVARMLIVLVALNHPDEIEVVPDVGGETLKVRKYWW